jgi:release factor glutamine methyltransferase
LSLQPARPGGARTVLDLLNKAEGFLQERGSGTPRLDAQVLLAKVLSLRRIDLYLQFERPLAKDEVDVFRDLVRRRGAHEPVAYLVGQKEFWSLPFAVGPQALIPRPDTETLLEMVGELYPAAPPARFADVGTGSGCIACALARMFPAAAGVAVDSQESALQLARRNAEDLAVLNLIDLRQGDLLLPTQGERFDLVCANLPYIPSGDWAKLPPEVRDFEPRVALDGGPDGLDLVRRLILQAPGQLNAGGWLVLEIGVDQAQRVSDLLSQAGLETIRQKSDLAGIPRAVAGHKP